VAVVGDKLVLFGGSDVFNSSDMSCNKTYGDTYTLSISKCVNLGSDEYK